MTKFAYYPIYLWPKCLEFCDIFRIFATKKHENMTKDMEIKSLSEEFDFSAVPIWYVFCTNAACPLRQDCMRYFAASKAPRSMESARCVMPGVLVDGQCRWFDRKKVVVQALGFEHLYDKVMKQDYTSMRKSITRYLHGVKMYYESKHGDRPLSPEQQQGIRQIVRDYGYTWEVPFDCYREAYEFGKTPLPAE